MVAHQSRRYVPVTREELDPEKLPPLLRMSEVTALLDCHERTVRGLVSSGDLPGYRLGREFRFKATDVLALLKPIPTTADTAD